MEIRFCDLCQESIPEDDFATGRAFKVEARSVCVTCVARRALSARATAPAWLALVLALCGVGAAVYLLSRPGVPDGVSTEVAQAIHEQAELTRREAAADQASLRGEVSALGGGLKTSLELVSQDAKQLETRDLKQHQEVQGRLDRQDGRLGTIERAQEEVQAWLQELRTRAAQAAAAPVPESYPPGTQPAPAAPSDPLPTPAAPPVPAPVPTPAPATPAPGTAGPGADDATLRRYIELLGDPNPSLAFTAALQLGHLKDLRATPALIKALKTNKDFYVRLGAADALKELQACDAVGALIEAVEDKDDLVRTSANEALKVITRHEEPFVPNAPRPELRKVARAWEKWWKENEESVRRRLNQPKV